MYNYVFFDLDGTLTNSSVGIYNALYYCFDKMGVEAPDSKIMRKFIGPPLLVSFKELMGMTDEESVRALKLYRENYSAKGIYENEPYDGVREMLEYLFDGGVKIGLCSTKPQFMCDEVLSHFDLTKYFSCISGCKTEKMTKTETIQNALEFFGIDNDEKKNVLMVGDRKFDILSARECGIDSCGAAYGFPDERELEDAGATFIVNDAFELFELLKKRTIIGG